jgi:hypothetical protein
MPRNKSTTVSERSWDSSVGIAMGYRMDGPGSIPGRWKIFLFFIALGPTQPPVEWLMG